MARYDTRYLTPKSPGWFTENFVTADRQEANTLREALV
jgi:hypothetical protein